MAELLREAGAQDEATTDATTNSGTVSKLVGDLVEHWDAVGSTLGLADHPPLPHYPLETPVASPNDNVKTSEINNRLSVQDNKIDQILALVKSLKNKFKIPPEKHTNNTNFDTVKPSKRKRRKGQQSGTPLS